MKLILINGQPGSGKTSIAKALLNDLRNAAYIETDSLVAVNPFELNEDLNNLAAINAVSLIKNFSAAGYQNMIVSGLIKNQKELDRLLGRMDKNKDLVFVWLRASKEVRMERKQERARDGADSIKYFEFIDALIPDVENFELNNGKYISINTTSKTIQEVVNEIKVEI